MILCLGTTPAAQRVMVFRSLGDESGALLKMDCLDVPGGAKEAGIKILLWPCNSGDNQAYDFTLAQDKRAQIKNRASGLCLNAGGNDLVQTPCDGAAAGLLVSTTSPTTFRLKSADGRCLAINEFERLAFGDCNSSKTNLKIQTL